MTHEPSRRTFIKQAGTACGASFASSLMGTLAVFADSAEAAPTTQPSDYKALVCIYLAGGNDAFNTLVYDVQNPSHPAYKSGRLATIALPEAFLKPLKAGSRSGLALNSAMSNMLSYYQGTGGAVKMAIVANVGPLKQSVTKATYAPEITTPAKLYSHNDQTSIWLTQNLEGNGSGWGAQLVGEVMPAGSGNVSGLDFTNISFDQSSAFSANQAGTIRGYTASSRQGAIRPGAYVNDGGGIFYHAKEMDTIWPLLRGDYGLSSGTATSGGHLLEMDYVQCSKRSLDSWGFLEGVPTGALGGATTPAKLNKIVAPSAEPLDVQLNMVASFIKSRASIGCKRQVFFVQLGGFDTHAGQARPANQTTGARSNDPHSALLETLDTALARFYAAIAGDENLVTTFTASEFGRKLKGNASGTDHGWGGHHFVIGGSQINQALNAAGGVFGRVPDLSTGTSPQMLDDGTMIPEYSTDQYAYHLGKWFNVPEARLQAIFPKRFVPPAASTLSAFLV